MLMMHVPGIVPVVMIMMMESQAAGNRRSGGVTDNATGDGADRTTNDSACGGAHRSITDPFLRAGGCRRDRDARYDNRSRQKNFHDASPLKRYAPVQRSWWTMRGEDEWFLKRHARGAIVDARASRRKMQQAPAQYAPKLSA